MRADPQRRPLHRWGVTKSAPIVVHPARWCITRLVMAEPSSQQIGVGTIIAGAYEITGLIGRGGTSTVWRANQLRLPGREVALKVLTIEESQRAEATVRLQLERQILCRIQHPNIVQIVDASVLGDGTPYLVVECLEGETLQQRLARHRPPLDMVSEIARQIASALTEAHRAGVVHGDLKPGNIFLCATTAPSPVRDVVKILDFGMSQGPGVETYVEAPGTGGTPQYMAPERLLRPYEPADARADIFSFGAILYEMVAGRPAFSGDSVHGVALQVVEAQPEPIRQLVPDVPPSLAQVIERALDKDPGRRFRTVTEMMAAIEAPRAPVAAPAQRAPRSVPARVPLYDNPWVAFLLGLVAFGAVTMLILALSQLGQPSHLTVRSATFAGDVQPTSATVAVLTFENQRPDDSHSDWYGRALQQTTSTEFGRVRELGVIAPETMVREEPRYGGDIVATARSTGATWIITGSYLVIGAALRIDAKVIDAVSRLQVASASVEGVEGDYLNLQKRLVTQLLKELDVEVSGDEAEALKQKQRVGADQVRRLLEAEGVTRSRARPPQDGVPHSSVIDLSRIDRWAVALADLVVSPAHAAEADERLIASVLEFLEVYRSAHERGDAEALADLYFSFPEAQRQAVTEYARSTDTLRVAIDDVTIEPEGDEVVTSYTRRDSFRDAASGERVSVEVRLTRYLVREGDRWKFAPD